MHDIRTIRDNPAAFDAALSRRGVSPVSSEILAIDEARRAKILAAETAQAEANKAAKEVGAAKARGHAYRNIAETLKKAPQVAGPPNLRIRPNQMFPPRTDPMPAVGKTP